MMPSFSPKDFSLPVQAMIPLDEVDHTDDWTAYCAAAKRLDRALILERLAEAISCLETGAIHAFIDVCRTEPFTPGHPSELSRFTHGMPELGLQVARLIAAITDEQTNLGLLVGEDR